MQRILQPLVLVAALTLASAAPRAAEMQYGVSFEPTVAADGAVSVIIRNLSKVPVTLRGLTVGVPGSASCVAETEPVTVGPGAVVAHAVKSCRAPAERRLLMPLSEALDHPAAVPRPAGLTLAATLDRLGQSHEVKAGWSTAAP